jgi:hypothetical protein
MPDTRQYDAAPSIGDTTDFAINGSNVVIGPNGIAVADRGRHPDRHPHCEPKLTRRGVQ